jgi:hypothetical protein
MTIMTRSNWLTTMIPSFLDAPMPKEKDSKSTVLPQQPKTQLDCY